MANRIKILIMRLGSAGEEVIAQFGDFHDMVMNAPEARPEIQWCSPVLLDIVPDEMNLYNGIILTGAYDSLTKPYKYLKSLEQVFDTIIRHEVPTFGICFGHQLINLLMGGEISRNPVGPEMGVSTISLNFEARTDKHFGTGVPGKVEVYESHFDIVSQAANCMTRLAWNDMAQYQATRFSNFIYSTQFHPEFTAPIMEHFIRKFYNEIKSAHRLDPVFVDHPDDILKRNKKIHSSGQFLTNFLDLVASKTSN